MSKCKFNPGGCAGKQCDLTPCRAQVMKLPNETGQEFIDRVVNGKYIGRVNLNDKPIIPE